MKYVCAIALIIFCGATNQAVAVNPGQFMSYGSGAASCGKWLASSHDSGDRNRKLNWVLGWLSAAGYYDVLGSLKETDSDAIAAWVDNYCRDKPLDTISNAASALVRTLAVRGQT